MEWMMEQVTGEGSVKTLLWMIMTVMMIAFVTMVIAFAMTMTIA